MPNISEIFGLQVPVAVKNSKAIPIRCPDPSLLYGVELEIEGIPGNPEALYVPGMRGERDNSLRENAHGVPWEFITKPATYSVLVTMLEQFFSKANLTLQKNYSERCSVHIHANVLDFTTEQLKSLCLLYQVFERLLYAFAGNDRDKNIFCVPWSQTQLTHAIIDSLTPEGIPNLRNWQKYTGMNLIPVTTQGTVEFRHLPGTPDVKRILDWAALLGCLFAYARTVPYEQIKSRIIEINTTSAYAGTLNDVFTTWAPLLDSPAKNFLLEEGVLDVKYMLISAGKKKEMEPNQWVTFGPGRDNNAVWIDDALQPAPAVVAGDDWVARALRDQVAVQRLAEERRAQAGRAVPPPARPRNRII